MKLFHGALNPEAEFVTVIMAGGSGTRFWPMSRKSYPKQYLALSPDGRSLLRATVDRMQKIQGTGSVLIVTAESQLELVKEHAPGAAILCEPTPRNTAPCLGFAAERVLHDVGDVPMVCIPADHLVDDEDALRAVYEAAIDIARSENVVATIGIPPTSPETGFGYIRRGAEFRPATATESTPCDRVDAFVEKPSRERAEEYVASGMYLWNAGMVVWRPSVLLGEISKHLPHLAEALKTIRTAFSSADGDRTISDAFHSISPISIDFGVMEKAANAVVLPAMGIGWSDVGSWDAWADKMLSSEHASAERLDGEVLNVGDVLAVQCRRSAFWSTGKLIAALGVEDIVVVETDNAILVCQRDAAQDVRQIVDELKKRGRDELI